MKKVCLFIFVCGFISYNYSQNIIKSLDSNKVEIIDQNAKMALDSNKILWEQTLVKSENSPDSVVCNVQWAGSVVKFSSEFSKIEKSATMIIGKPNSMPVGGDSPLAWAVKDKGGRETPGEAFIRVGYVAPMRIQQVAIAESFNPGSITKVVIYGVGGEELKIYEGSPLAYKNTTRMFAIFLDKPTDFYVKEIEITMNPEAVPGWNMIDAVGVSDCKDSIRAKINLIPNLHFDSKPENLGASINSIYDETAPFISPDGKSLLIVRKFHPENAGGFQDKDDIWWSKLDDNGKWTPAKNIGQPLNNKFSNFVQSITPDGNSLLLGNAYNKDGTMTDGVSFTYRTREGWAFPEKQMIDGFYNLSQYANYFLSNDGRQLLMAVEMKDSYGGLDLYISFRRGDNRWSKPLNLGPGINTAFNDYSPFLAADGVTLYYSTSGLAGYGKEDIFVVQRQDDSWINWTEPQNMGSAINSAQSDSKYNLPASGEYAYYSSEINTANKSDIYRIALPKQVKPKAVVIISGKVINEKTNEPVDARIIVEELPDGTEVAIARTNPNTGEFKIVLPAGKKYGFRAIGLGYFETNKNIDLTEINEYQEIEDEFMRLAPIEIGQVVRLNNIFFDFAKATLKEESFPELDRTVEFLKNNPKLEIEIAGHTDNISTDEYNQKLSQARAESVANYIISKGIESNRVTAVGYGESRPVAFNNDEEGRAQNRRVEFKVLKL
jgi:outer membrane protein OmpA-like peptidoglycan-associated protein